MGKRNLALYIFLLLALAMQAQNICIGEKQQLYASVLHEEREIYLQLPKSYHTPAGRNVHYPVIYLLDADWHFQQLSAVYDALSGGLYTYMPEAILVGICNTDRSRDLTPSNDTVMHSGQPVHTTSGGAANFQHFLIHELGAYIDSSYRTNGYNILSGHSFGGLFTLYALQEDQSFFKAYLAHDPSLWWDEALLPKQFQEKYKDGQYAGKSLYLSIAHVDTTQTDRFRHTATIRSFHAWVQAHPETGLNYQMAYFQQEDHGTIPLPALYDGLRTIFSGITLPVKKVPYQCSLVSAHYEALSQKLGYTFKPEVSLCQRLIAYCERVQQMESAVQLLDLLLKYHPANPEAHYLKAKYWQKQGNASAAQQALSEAIALAPDLQTDYEERFKNK